MGPPPPSALCPRWQAPSADIAYAELTEQSAEVAEIVFFLLGAMTIVEIVDAHQGFRLVTDSIRTRDSRKLLWLVRKHPWGPLHPGGPFTWVVPSGWCPSPTSSSDTPAL